MNLQTIQSLSGINRASAAHQPRISRASAAHQPRISRASAA
jgi:hypothetical protein